MSTHRLREWRARKAASNGAKRLSRCARSPLTEVEDCAQHTSQLPNIYRFRAQAYILALAIGNALCCGEALTKAEPLLVL